MHPWTFSQQSLLWAPLLVLAVGPSNPLGGPATYMYLASVQSTSLYFMPTGLHSDMITGEF